MLISTENLPQNERELGNNFVCNKGKKIFFFVNYHARAKNLILFFWFLVISEYSHVCPGLDTRLESGIYVDMGCYNKLSLYRKQVQNTKVTGLMSVSVSVR